MLLFESNFPKELVFEQISIFLAEKNLYITKQDFARPWGGFFVLDENQQEEFVKLFFPHLPENFGKTQKLSPKILVIAPQKRISWQYHHRRSEIWKLIGGEAGVIISTTNQENPIEKLSIGQILELEQGLRHRLVGLSTYGIVAEIWQHTDPNNPSDEEDIVRLQDDFGR